MLPTTEKFKSFMDKVMVTDLLLEFSILIFWQVKPKVFVTIRNMIKTFESFSEQRMLLLNMEIKSNLISPTQSNLTSTFLNLT